jgi:signal peptidase I
MRGPLRIRLLAGTVGLALIVGGWILLGPRQLGGSASYAIVAGSSMEPRLHHGDLVVARSRSHYAIGDAVVYHNAQLDQNVLHRIIGRDGSRFVFKGDNNGFVDPTHPQQSDLLGSLWFTVPGLGSVVEWLRVPLHAALIAALASLLAFGVGGPGRRRLRSTVGLRELAHRTRARAARPGFTSAGAPVAWIVAALVASCMLGVVAFTRDSAPLVSNGAWKQRGTFSYSARAPRGPVYPAGRIATGDAVFLRLVPVVNIQFDYRLQAPFADRLAGTAALELTVRGSNGWQSSMQLAPSKRFNGDHVLVQGRVQLERLRSLISSVERLTGTTSPGYTVTVQPRIAVRGRLDGDRVSTSFAPPLTFLLDELHLQLQQPASSIPGGDPGDSLHPVQSAAVSRPPAAVSVGPVPVGVARMVAVLGVLASLLALAVFGGLLPLGSVGGEEIPARYRSMLVPVGKPRHSAVDGWVVDVDSFQALAQLAEHYDRLILHQHHTKGESYLVEEGGIAYRYTPETPLPTLSGEEVPSIAPTGL